MRSISNLEIPVCVACGSEMSHVLRHGYRRCDDCVAAGRPHSLVLARGARAARLRAAVVLGDYDPAGCAAAA
jgi:hypothetical protein